MTAVPTKAEIAAVIGHEPTDAVYRVIVALHEYVQRKHNERPEIPVEQIWDKVHADLTAILNESEHAEG